MSHPLTFFHLFKLFKLDPSENDEDLNVEKNSISHPTRRPRAPIATTRKILLDLVAPVTAKMAVRIDTVV